jgi:hypothetical protein
MNSDRKMGLWQLVLKDNPLKMKLRLIQHHPSIHTKNIVLGSDSSPSFLRCVSSDGLGDEMAFQSRLVFL